MLVCLCRILVVPVNTYRDIFFLAAVMHPLIIRGEVCVGGGLEGIQSGRAVKSCYDDIFPTLGV